MKMSREPGRPRNLNSPDELLELWDEYKAYLDARPDKENVVTAKGDVVEKQTKKPYLRQGFEAYCFRKHKISVTDYLSGEYKEFSQVVTCIRREWEEDQISGTITGKYKAPNLVARLNGLVEKTQAEVKADVKVEDVTIKIFDSKEEKK